MEQKNGSVTIEVEEEPGNNAFLIALSLIISIIALGAWWYFVQQLAECGPDICRLVNTLANVSGGVAIIGCGSFLIGLCITLPSSRKRKPKK
jgi:hypothetical protein